jgi:hypothetical protein
VTIRVDPEQCFDAVAPYSRDSDPVDTTTLLARGRLADARKWFARLGWDVLPQSIRGRRILQWGADHAWLAAPSGPQRSVRLWCRRWAPWLTVTELNKLVTDTENSNKRWSHDQSAAVLEVSAADREKFKLWHIGANDDPNYEIRRGILRTKAAERARKYRAANGTGAKRGRPELKLSQEEALARRRAQDAERARKYRASRKNASRPLIYIDPVTEFSVTETNPKPIQSDGRRQPAPRPSKTVSERKDARCREPTISNVSEEEALLNAQFGELDRTFGYKSRMSERMPLSKKAREYGLAAGFRPEQVKNMFETFISWNMAKGTYSSDWDGVWRDWVNREVDIVNERNRRDRARAWFERVASGPVQSISMGGYDSAEQTPQRA